MIMSEMDFFNRNKYWNTEKCYKWKSGWVSFVSSVKEEIMQYFSPRIPEEIWHIPKDTNSCLWSYSL